MFLDNNTPVTTPPLPKPELPKEPANDMSHTDLIGRMGGRRVSDKWLAVIMQQILSQGSNGVSMPRFKIQGLKRNPRRSKKQLRAALEHAKGLVKHQYPEWKVN